MEDGIIRNNCFNNTESVGNFMQVRWHTLGLSGGLDGIEWDCSCLRLFTSAFLIVRLQKCLGMVRGCLEEMSC